MFCQCWEKDVHGLPLPLLTHSLRSRCVVYSAVRAVPCLARHLSSGGGSGPDADSTSSGSGGRAGRLAALGAGAALAGTALWLAQRRRLGPLVTAASAGRTAYGQRRADLPTFSMDEVSRHADMKDGVWMTYNEGVYDVTEFVRRHPGTSQDGVPRAAVLVLAV